MPPPNPLARYGPIGPVLAILACGPLGGIVHDAYILERYVSPPVTQRPSLERFATLQGEILKHHGQLVITTGVDGADGTGPVGFDNRLVLVLAAEHQGLLRQLRGTIDGNLHSRQRVRTGPQENGVVGVGIAVGSGDGLLQSHILQVEDSRGQAVL